MNKKRTSANMKRCDVNHAEDHIYRRTDLDYTRKELEPNNIYRSFASIKDSLAEDRQLYVETVGQKMQPHASPIREIVVYGMTSETQAEAFKKYLEKHFGVTVLGYAIHLDEGHEDVITHEWIPNYHAQFLVDTMCREHTLVWRPVKSNGRIKRDEEGKVIRRQVGNYGKTIKFSKQMLSKMQDFAAKATGLERGIPSTRQHINARQQKVLGLEKDITRLEAKKEDLEADIGRQEAHLGSLSRESQRLLEGAYRSGIATLRASADDVLHCVSAMSTLLGAEGRQLPGSARTIAAKLNLLRSQDTTKMSMRELQNYFARLNQGVFQAIPLLSVSLSKGILHPDDARLMSLTKESQTHRKRVEELEKDLQKADEALGKVDSLEDDLKNLLLEQEEHNLLLDGIMRNIQYSATKELVKALEAFGLPKLVGIERWKKFLGSGESSIRHDTHRLK